MTLAQTSGDVGSISAPRLSHPCRFSNGYITSSTKHWHLFFLCSWGDVKNYHYAKFLADLGIFFLAKSSRFESADFASAMIDDVGCSGRHQCTQCDSGVVILHNHISYSIIKIMGFALGHHFTCVVRQLVCYPGKTDTLLDMYCTSKLQIFLGLGFKCYQDYFPWPFAVVLNKTNILIWITYSIMLRGSYHISLLSTSSFNSNCFDYAFNFISGCTLTHAAPK